MIELTQVQARRFLLAHQRLWPPRQLQGRAGVLDHVGQVGCIQFDPVNIAGRNPDLVLQARLAGYRPELLAALLYEERALLGGWDKMASIYLAADWPFFARHRARMRQHYGGASNPAMALAPAVLEAIRDRGQLSSLDLDHEGTVQSWWGQPARLVGATLEALYLFGDLGIDHRVGSRRVYDLIERLVPAGLLTAPDPNPTEESYQEWHVLRRAGGLGLCSARAADYWLAIPGVKAPQRRTVLDRLVEQGRLLPTSVEGVSDRTFYLRSTDLPALEAVLNSAPPEPAAAFLPPLDNLLWDRDLLRRLFGFDYTWELYKPASQRRYGSYVLPVLYGERFVARFDPALDRKRRELAVTNWWWEQDVEPDGAMEAALAACTREFLAALGAVTVRLGAAAAGDPRLRWAEAAGGYRPGPGLWTTAGVETDDVLRRPLALVPAPGPCGRPVAPGR